MKSNPLIPTLLLMPMLFASPVASAIPASPPTFGMTFVAQPVAVSGDPLPGVDGENGVTFDQFHSLPLLTNDGRTAFRVKLAGPEVNSSNDFAIFGNTQGPLSLIAREGDDAPVLGANVSFNNLLSDPVVNGNGEITFLAVLGGEGLNPTNNRAIFHKSAGEDLLLLARTGELAPGISGDVRLAGFSITQLNDNGQTAFIGFLVGEGVEINENDTAIFRENNPGDLSLIARAGEPTGMGADINFDFFRGLRPGSDQSVAQVSLTGETPNGDVREAFFRVGADGALEVIAQNGDPAPGISDVTFGNLGFSSFAVNRSGRAAIFAYLDGESLDGTNGQALYRESATGQLELVARAGDPAPVAAGEATYQEFRFVPAIGDDGQTAFIATIVDSGGNISENDALFRANAAGEISLFARRGDPVPGLDGAEFGFLQGANVALNDKGRIAIQVFLEGENVDAANSEAILAEDLDGELRVIARTGGVIDVNTDPQVTDERTIEHLFLAGFEVETSNQNGFNNRGQVAFLASFTDGSGGIFVSNAATVPEPGSIVIVAFGVAGMVSFRRLRTLIN